MKRFQDKIYALSQKGLLLWEPSWETFRPVVAVVWNPAHNQLEPYFGIYTNDIFDVDYGFGDSNMHDFCIEFTDENAYDVSLYFYIVGIYSPVTFNLTMQRVR